MGSVNGIGIFYVFVAFGQSANCRMLWRGFSYQYHPVYIAKKGRRGQAHITIPLTDPIPAAAYDQRYVWDETALFRALDYFGAVFPGRCPGLA